MKNNIIEVSTDRSVDHGIPIAWLLTFSIDKQGLKMQAHKDNAMNWMADGVGLRIDAAIKRRMGHMSYVS